MKIMNPIQIKPIEKDITIRYSGEKVKLSPEAETKISAHWKELTKSKPSLRNGEVFTVTEVKETPSGLVVQLAETNYAHYLCSYQVGGLGDYTVRIIHSSALVITSDEKLVFGAMGEQTSRPGIIQCVGGGIDHNDIHDGKVDLEHNTAKELREELGIDPYDKSRVMEFSPQYFKFGGPTGKMTVVYVTHLKQSALEFLKSYHSFIEKLKNNGEEPEFGKVFTIARDTATVDNFITNNAEKLDEYMEVLLNEVKITTPAKEQT